MKALDTLAEFDHRGNLSARAQARLTANLRGRADAAGLQPGETGTARLRVSGPVRSTAANNLYWACLERLALHLHEAGAETTKEGIHADAKGIFLPLVAAECLRETGEVVDYVVETVGLPPRDGSAPKRKTLLTTTTLSSYAFSLYLSHVDGLAARYGCDLSDLLDGEDLTGYRSGRIEEPDGLDEVEYVREGRFFVPAGDEATCPQDGPMVNTSAAPVHAVDTSAPTASPASLQAHILTLGEVPG